MDFVVQSPSCVHLFVTPWTVACQASLLYIYVCVCVYMYMCVYIYMYVFIYTYIGYSIQKQNTHSFQVPKEQSPE